MADSVLHVQDGTKRLTITCMEGETILQALRRAGRPISTQCEKGYCGSCMIQLLEGSVILRANDVLSPTDLKEGMRLACQGLVTSAEAEIELL